MNRAQRRSKKTASRVTPSWHGAPLKTLLKASVQPISQAEHAELTLPFLLQLAELKNGTLSVDGFIQLNEMIVSAFNLASDIWANSPQHSQEAVAPSEAVFTSGSETLAAIGERFNQRGRFIASGDELAKLEKASQWHADLIQVATQGMVLKALLKAEAQVRGLLEKLS
jgi:hypothetical protein